MKRLVLVMLVTSFSFNVGYSQGRKDDTVIKFESETDKLTEAIGWKKNYNTGKWIENKNYISDKHYKYNKYTVSKIEQNFKWMQFSTIVYNGVKYYVLLIEKFSGSYKYPYIQEEWQIETITYFFVITEDQYDFIKTTINLKNGKDVVIESEITGTITDKYKYLKGEHSYSEEVLLSKIYNKIKKPWSKECFRISSQKLDGNNLVRFRLPHYCDNGKENMIEYFEVKEDSFNKLLTL